MSYTAPLITISVLLTVINSMLQSRSNNKIGTSEYLKFNFNAIHGALIQIMSLLYILVISQMLAGVPN